jgi:hypothetical protein
MSCNVKLLKCCVRAVSVMTPAAMLAATSVAQPLLNTTTLATFGDAAPGGGVYSFFSVGTPSEDANLFSVNGPGQMILRSVLTGAGVTSANNVGLYVVGAGESSLVAREGSSAAGLPATVLHGDFTGALIADNGQVAFVGGLTGAGITASNNEALWAGPVGSLAIVVQRGSGAPGVAAPGVYSDLDAASLAVAANGQIAFRATLTGAGISTATDRAIWTGQAGTLILAAREGDAAPGTGAGVVFGNFDDLQANVAGSAGLKISNAGLLITGTLSGTGVTGSNDNGLWYKPQGGPLVKVVREGDAAANLTGVTYSAVLGNSLNAAGSVLFRPTLAGTGVTASNNALLAIWQPNGTTINIARKGELVPAVGPGITMSEFSTAAFLQPRLAANNAAAWVSTLAGTGVVAANNSAVLYRTPNGDVQLVLRRGTDAPEIGGDVTFSVIQGFSLASSQQVVVSVRLAGTGVTTSDDDAVYSWSPTRGLRLISRESTRISVNPLETRDVLPSGILNVRGFGTEEGQRQTITSAGQLVYRAVFTDNSSRFLLVNALQYPCGLADFAGAGAFPIYDGMLDNNDFVVFIQRFFAEDPLADVGSAGASPGSDLTWDNNDFIVFIQAFFEGC